MKKSIILGSAMLVGLISAPVMAGTQISNPSNGDGQEFIYQNHHQESINKEGMKKMHHLKKVIDSNVSTPVFGEGQEFEYQVAMADIDNSKTHKVSKDSQHNVDGKMEKNHSAKHKVGGKEAVSHEGEGQEFIYEHNH